MLRSFNVLIEQAGPITVLKFSGEISGLSNQAMQDAFTEAARGQPRAYLLDLSEVDYINSTGIALLVRIITLARREEQRVGVSGLNAHYTEIFQITRLVEYVDLYPDRESGLQGLQNAVEQREDFR